MQDFAKKKSVIWVLILISAVNLLTAQCTYITPEAENPVPGLEDPSVLGRVQNGILSVRKSFFGIQINQEKNTWSYEEKTWMCGWAPTSQSGSLKNFGGLTSAPYNSRHCNITFRLTEDGSALEALEVNVDKSNIGDWQTVFVIPVIQHYFYEKDVDNRGRELNRYSKVSDRKNWQLQPFMDLDLKGITFLNRSRSPISIGSTYSVLNQSSIVDIHDVDILKESGEMNFLAFTGNIVSSIFGSDVQHQVRFNFLEFKGSSDFQVTSYDPDSIAKKMNILHILGTREDGTSQRNYAAHWNLTKPIEVCLNGFPEDGRYKKIAIESLEETNRTLRKIGALKENQQGFIVSQREMKYSFDLRCPSINWVSDPELSMGAPLGIGLVNSNVRTGEILWGSAIIWGGLIDFLVNRDSESPVDALVRNTHEVYGKMTSLKNNPYFTDVTHQLNFKDIHAVESLKNISEMSDSSKMKELFSKLIEERVNQKMQSTNPLDENYETLRNYKLGELLGLDIESLLANASATSGNDSDARIGTLVSRRLNEVLNSLPSQFTENDLFDQYANFSGTEETLKQMMLQNSQLNSHVTYSDTDKEKFASLLEGGDSSEVQRILINDFKSLFKLDADWDNTVDQYYGQWLEQTAQMEWPEREEAALAVIKNVILHEWGHVLGMGHQFKGNILPERGTVPEELYQVISEKAKNHKYFSSIMDYQNGHSQVTSKAEDMTFNTQDDLVLSYLYSQKIATYAPGDDSFTMVDLPIDGSLTTHMTGDDGVSRPVRYMPQCSDLQDWLGVDPYCRRFDRGYDALTIVESNYNTFRDSFIKRMNSFTQATGGDAQLQGFRLWYDTYNLMNNNRTFYDRMRFELLDDIHNPQYFSTFDKLIGDRHALMQFSRACIDPSEANDRYQADFAMLSLQPTAIASRKIRPQDRKNTENYQQTNRELLRNYLSTLSEYGGKSYTELSADQVIEFENKLYSKGVAFSEIQKLCLATSESLKQTKTLLTLPGFDQTEYDFEGAVVPTGLRSANARADYTKVFGRYVTLGILPLKLAALSVLTSPSSTMRFGPFNVPKFQYSGSKGRYSYFALYPEEYTDIVNSSVSNNMSFGGRALGDKTTLSIANLYMSFFLQGDKTRTKDRKRRGFDETFLSDVHGQTSFRVNLSPVLLEGITHPDVEDSIIFGFTARIFSRAKDELIYLEEAYVLPNGNTIIRGDSQQIIQPISKLRFIGPNTAFVWALEITYQPTRAEDPLQGFSVKSDLDTLSKEALHKCIGEENGLASFFSSSNRSQSDDQGDKSQKFDGFQVSSTISSSVGIQRAFEASVQAQFDKYHQLPDPKTPAQIECSESRKNLEIISATASSLGGFILPQLFEYVE